MNVCIYCGTHTSLSHCPLCNEFDGIVTEEEWNKMIDEEELLSISQKSKSTN